MQQGINIKDGYDVFDLANKSGYTIDQIYLLLQQNSFISSLNYPIVSNQAVQYDDTYVIKKSPRLVQKASIIVSNISYYQIIDQQNIFDAVTQTYGSLDNTYKLIQDSAISNINEPILNGKIINFDSNLITDKGFYNTLNKKSIKIATGTKGLPNIQIGNFILRQDGFYLLRQDGGRFIRN